MSDSPVSSEESEMKAAPPESEGSAIASCVDESSKSATELQAGTDHPSSAIAVEGIQKDTKAEDGTDHPSSAIAVEGIQKATKAEDGTDHGEVRIIDSEINSVIPNPRPEEIEAFLTQCEEKQEIEAEKFAQKWNYDVKNDKPLEGRYQWTRIGGNDIESEPAANTENEMESELTDSSTEKIEKIEKIE